jgi:hypothetical protein
MIRNERALFDGIGNHATPRIVNRQLSRAPVHPYPLCVQRAKVWGVLIKK